MGMARFRLLLVAFCIFLMGSAAAAQQSPSQTPDKNSSATGNTPPRKKHNGVLGIVPTYDISNSKNLQPLTPGQKFHLAIEDSANPFEVAEAAVKAEYYRGTNPRKKIGYGGTGYLKQWGASYLDEISGNMFHTFLYPALLHQDPRYYRKGEGSIAGRVAYSFSRVFVTRGDAGQREFNASLVLGSATSTVLSNAYYPPRARSVGLTIGNVGWSLVGDGASNVFKEFWPDIAQRLSKNR
ncbi:MAG TPA: hypothetical protein VGY31_15015 [Terriglobia bacterium]|nr:hypothetical protein [Terriglobia bacterium]